MEEVTEKWRYVYSCDLDVNLEIKMYVYIKHTSLLNVFSKDWQLN